MFKLVLLRKRFFKGYFIAILIILLIREIIVPQVFKPSPTVCYPIRNPNFPGQKYITNMKIQFSFEPYTLLQSIPHHFHFIRISSTLSHTNVEYISEDVLKNIHSCVNLHPKWTYTIWTDRKIRSEFPHLVQLLLHTGVPAAMSDILRLHIVAQYGGIYLDTDFVCYKSFEGLIDSIHAKAFAANEDSSTDNIATQAVSNGIIGAVPHHPILVKASQEVLLRALRAEPPNSKTGPHLFGEMIRKYNSCADSIYVFSQIPFYPCSYTEECISQIELHRGKEDVYAIHLWYASWKFSKLI